MADLKQRLRQARRALYIYYTAPQELSFRSLRNGFVVFGVGLALILFSNTYLEPSLHQELQILAGLVICGIGFLISMRAYVRLVISRVVLFFSDEQHKKNK